MQVGTSYLQQVSPYLSQAANKITTSNVYHIGLAAIQGTARFAVSPLGGIALYLGAQIYIAEYTRDDDLRDLLSAIGCFITVYPVLKWIAQDVANVAKEVLTVEAGNFLMGVGGVMLILMALSNTRNNRVESDAKGLISFGALICMSVYIAQVASRTFKS